MNDLNYASTSDLEGRPARVVGLTRVSIERATEMLLALADGAEGTRSLGAPLEQAISDDSSPDLAYVLAGMASVAVRELASAVGQTEATVVGVLRARLLVVYAREG